MISSAETTFAVFTVVSRVVFFTMVIPSSKLAFAPFGAEIVKK